MQQEPDGGEAEEGDGGAGKVFEVLGGLAATAELSEGAFDDSVFGQDMEAGGVGALDDLNLPVGDGGERGGDARALVGGVGDDLGQEGKKLAHVLQERRAAVAVLHRGRMDIGVQQETERVDGEVALLAGIEARWINVKPPFSAPFTLWLSMMATVGLASRPARTRAST